MTEPAEAHFRLTARGPFSLAEGTRFLEGFAPAAYDRPGAASIDLAFAVEGSWQTVGVHLEQEGAEVTGQLSSTSGGLSDELVAATREQVERILSLDIDGTGFAAVGQADPVVAGLQRRYPGLRPVCFWSPYEAAAWAVIGQRIRIVQAAAIKERMAAELGEAVLVNGTELSAFPAPDRLAEVTGFPGLNEKKIGWLRGIAAAALRGDLAAAPLRALPREQALAQLAEIPGIGPFSAELILLRGAGDPDCAPMSGPRFGRAVAHAYQLAELPDTAELARISDAWRPYRTWVALLLRTQLEADTHEISGVRKS